MASLILLDIFSISQSFYNMEFTDIPCFMRFLVRAWLNINFPSVFVKQSTVYSSPGRYSVNSILESDNTASASESL